MSKTVVFLDDDKRLLELFGRIVGDDYPGVKVDLYNCPHEFLRSKKDFYDLIILDLSLRTTITGSEVARKIRKTDKESKIVVLTGFPLSLVTASFEGLKICGYWNKCEDLINLKSKLKIFLEEK